jgi:site-specific DNA recombinase
LLSNEKYCGDVMLMKTFKTGGISSKRKRNDGQADRYLAMSNHPLIIDKEAFEAVQKEKVKRSNVEMTDEGAKRKIAKYSAKKGMLE